MSDGEGSDFATAPVAPGGGRRPLLVGIVAVGLIAGSLVLSRLTPAPEAGEVAIASPVASVAPASQTPSVQPIPAASASASASASAPPFLEWYSAQATPLRDLLLESGSIRWMRLSSGRFTEEALAQPGDDLLLPGARGGTVCLCWQPSGTESGDPRDLQVIRRDNDLEEVAPRLTVMTVNGLDLAGHLNAPTQVAMEPSPDGRLVYLVQAIRSATAWQVRLDVIDLASGVIIDSLDLLSIAQDDRSIVLSVEPPTLRIAPDGVRLLVMAGTQRILSSDVASSTRRAWVVSLDSGKIIRAVPADAINDAGLDGPTGACAWIGFATNKVIAKGCPYLGADGTDRFEVRRYDLAGRDLGMIPLDSQVADPTSVVIDAVAGTVYTWDPDDHVLQAFDAVDGASRSARQSSATLANPETVMVTVDRPAMADPTRWTDGRSATDPAVSRTLVGSADGQRLYAVGTDLTTGGTSGVWVFDAASLRLVERWPASAVYDSIALFEGGRWLAALGRPGVTPAGGPADWGTTLTILDTLTGKPVMRVGEVGDRSSPVTFPWLGSVVATP